MSTFAIILNVIRIVLIIGIGLIFYKLKIRPTKNMDMLKLAKSYNVLFALLLCTIAIQVFFL